MAYSGKFSGNRGSVVNSPAEGSVSVVSIDDSAYGRQFLEDDEARPNASELDSPHRVITSR